MVSQVPKQVRVENRLSQIQQEPSWKQEQDQDVHFLLSQVQEQLTLEQQEPEELPLEQEEEQRVPEEPSKDYIRTHIPSVETLLREWDLHNEKEDQDEEYKFVATQFHVRPPSRPPQTSPLASASNIRESSADPFLPGVEADHWHTDRQWLWPVFLQNIEHWTTIGKYLELRKKFAQDCRIREDFERAEVAAELEQMVEKAVREFEQRLEVEKEWDLVRDKFARALNAVSFNRNNQPRKMDRSQEQFVGGEVADFLHPHDFLMRETRPSSPKTRLTLDEEWVEVY
ncbi:MAG: hypothetical protein Q9190_004499 [Brigantiaea leucoxantha]